MGRTPAESAGGVVFTEPHASTVADMDGDGIPDFVVGKRYWSHLDDYYDPDPYGAPVLYVYRTIRDKSAPGGRASSRNWCIITPAGARTFWQWTSTGTDRWILLRPHGAAPTFFTGHKEERKGSYELNRSLPDR